MNNYIFLIRRRTYTDTVIVDSEVTQYFLENKSKDTAKKNTIMDLQFIVRIAKKFF